MKSWHIFALGTAVLVAGFMLLPFIAYVAVLVAVLMIAVVAIGFLLVPDTDSWQVWVTRYDLLEGEDDYLELYSTQEPIAIRAELSRLWILYIPTTSAVGFLIFMYIRETWMTDITFDFSYGFVELARAGILLVWLLLTSWVFERWLLRRADAAHASLETRGEGRFLSYYFVVNREYYGGFNFILVAYRHEPELKHVVIFRRRNPQINRLVPAFLFHRFKVIGRGMLDLEKVRQMALQQASKSAE